MVRVLHFARMGYLVMAGFAAGSCVDSHECTEIGCVDQASVSLRTESGEWQPGAYALALSFDGTDYACSFDVPDDLPANGSVGMLSCSPRLDAYINQEVTCMEYTHGDSVSQSCTPIPDQYYVSVSVMGTPASVDVSLERDGDTLVEETHELSYEEARPNGPECEPLCRQASVEVNVP